MAEYNYKRMSQADWDELIRKQGYDRAAEFATNFGTVIDETGLPPLAAARTSQSRPGSDTVASAPRGSTTMDTPQGALPGGAEQQALDPSAELAELYRKRKAAFEPGGSYLTQAKTSFEQGQQRINEMYGGPSQSQMLFALSRALLSPRKFGGFAGTMANVSQALGGIAEQSQTAQQKRAEALARLQASYDERVEKAGFTAAELQAELLKTQIAADKPRVARPVGTEVVDGKLVAISQDQDTGEFTKTEIGNAPANLKPIPNVTSGGQPVFMGPNGPQDAAGNPVAQFDTKAKPLTATEQRQLFDTEDMVNSGLSTISTLEEALSLNEQAYEGSLSGWRKTLGQLFSSDDPRYVATENFDNLIMTGALQSLKATFGANPTEGERKILLDLQAISSKPRAVRDQILRRATEAAKTRLQRNTQQLTRLKSGEYSTRGGSTAPATTAPRVINWK